MRSLLLESKLSEKVILFSLRPTGSMILRMTIMTLFDPRYDEQVHTRAQLPR